MVLFKVEVESELGRLIGVVEGDRLLVLTSIDGWPELSGRLSRRLGSVGLRDGPAPKRVARALARYFGGRLDALAALDVDPGGSAFQAAVWTALRTIPAGERRTYVEVGLAIGKPRSIRAVAQAVAANPIQLVIPCHRVTAAEGRIPGTDAVLERRRWLLAHEAGAERARRGTARDRDGADG